VDPYVVLGVAPGASPAEIDAAYARRLRLHDPAQQATDDDRNAARRFHAELGEAYRSVLGTAPPAPTPDPPGAPRATPVGPSRPRGGRDWLVVLGALVAAYLLIQVPVALGFGLGGAVAGWVAAIAVIVFALVKLHKRRS
jgi:hypothetical protein